MIAALILVLAVGGLLQFGVAYCRTLLLTYGQVELSQRARDLAALEGEAPSGETYSRLVRLLRVAPDPGDDHTEMAAVGAYYHAMRVANWAAALVSGGAREWTAQELSRCAHFAAVTLDRRLASIGG